jgi:arylsulfatase A-like enzyme
MSTLPRAKALYRTLSTMLLATAAMATVAQAAEPITKPDVIVLLIDELGPNIMGPNARKTGVVTLNIDAMAARGIVFTNGSGQPTCVPARAELQAGKYPQRRSIGVTVGNTPYPKASMVTIAERLRPLGYATHAIGKWHMGQGTGQHPLDQGYDDWLGWSGAPYSPKYYGPDPNEPLYRNRTVIQNVGWVTDTIGNETVRLLQQERTKPRLFYVAFTAMHYPLLESLPATLKRMDDQIGRIVKAADPNTLFLFAGDNGLGYTPPFVGQKYSIQEGGVRVKYQMAWKDHVAPGRVDIPVSLVDFSPTIMAAAGSRQTDTDGQNLFALPANRHIMFDAFYDDPGIGVRFKWLKFYKNYLGRPTALYDLKTDPGEARNLAADPRYAAQVTYLTGLVNQYKAKLAD